MSIRHPCPLFLYSFPTMPYPNPNPALRYLVHVSRPIILLLMSRNGSPKLLLSTVHGIWPATHQSRKKSKKVRASLGLPRAASTGKSCEEQKAKKPSSREERALPEKAISRISPSTGVKGRDLHKDLLPPASEACSTIYLSKGGKRGRAEREEGDRPSCRPFRASGQP